MMRAGGGVLAIGVIAAALATQGPGSSASAVAADGAIPIQHVVILMQENRSFDSYFGTYPGATGLRRQHGHFVPCLPDPQFGGCQRPHHDRSDKGSGGPHWSTSYRRDYNGGRMDGFVAQAEIARNHCDFSAGATCTATRPIDVMGFHDDREIPNYWAYARTYVLQDHMYAAGASWSLPEHLFLVSGWSATCSTAGDPASCRDAALRHAGPTSRGKTWPEVHYDWTDLTYLLHQAGVSWRYYVESGGAPDCPGGQVDCPMAQQRADLPSIWNPLPAFTDVHDDAETSSVVPEDELFTDAAAGRLPAVSWVVPNERHSEHPPGLVSAGQAQVTRIVNALMSGPDWSSTAIFLTWDEWGGYYDHLPPPVVDAGGYGFRVPGLVISPYARQGYVDHQQLSSDAYLRFIEDVFLGGQRLDPATDGRPDPRPTVRDAAPGLGDLMQDFDFSRPPRPPLLLPVHPATDLR